MPTKQLRPLPPISRSDIERFKKYIDTTPGHGPNGDCHVWTGGRTPKGYGVMMFYPPKQTVRAPRVGYFIHYGEDPYPDLVCHTCDFPPCARGEHLFKGDSSANMRDASAKGRLATGDNNGSRLHPGNLVRGIEHHNAKVTDEISAEMRLLYSEEKISTYELARRFGICRSTAARIVKGIGWKHAGGSPTSGNLTACGERARSTKATAEQVIEIRAKAAQGRTLQSLADEYGLGLTTVHFMVTRKSWKHIP